MNAAQILDSLVGQTGTDASRATLLSLLNEAYGQQVADARWFRTEASIGTTVAGQADYTIPSDVIEGYGLRVGLYPYEPIGEDIMWRVRTGEITFATGPRGYYSQGFGYSGTPQISLLPVPQTGGDPITLYAARQPTALTDSSGSTPITPPDTHSSLIAGTSALVLGRIDERPDLAAGPQAVFDTVTEKLRRRKNSLLRGGQPARMLVKGVNC